MLEALQFEFMRNALLAGILVSLSCGIIGSLVVVNRMVFISGGVAHAAYGGIGIAYFLRQNPVVGAIIFSIFSAMGMGWLQRRMKERADTLIGVLWAVGMAIGIIFLDLTPGYKTDLMSYLFGSILAVPQSDLWLMAVIDVMIMGFVIGFYKPLLALSFDETFATIRNLPVEFLYLAMMAAIALTVGMMMKVVGLIMVIALLTIPAAISGQYVKDLKMMMVIASALGMVFTTLGLGLSYFLNLTSGATIILVASLTYFGQLFGSKYYRFFGKV